MNIPSPQVFKDIVETWYDFYSSPSPGQYAATEMCIDKYPEFGLFIRQWTQSTAAYDPDGDSDWYFYKYTKLGQALANP